MRELVHRTTLDVPVALVQAWHRRPGAIERLCAPWEDTQVQRWDGNQPGDRLVTETRYGPVLLTMESENLPGDACQVFDQVQVRGPYRSWRHQRRCIPQGPRRCLVEDRVRYALPLGDVGEILAGAVLEQSLHRRLRFAHGRLADDLERHQDAPPRPWDVGVTGVASLVAPAFISFLRAGGHQVRRLVRDPRGPGEARWSADQGAPELEALQGLDAVVHLAGEPSMGRLNRSHRRHLVGQRLKGTARLAKQLAALREPPQVLVCASSTAVYGDRGDRLLDERDAPGHGVLSGLCQLWESAAEPAKRAGIRVVHVRVGLVLSPRGGALETLLSPVWLGMGGGWGEGRQWLPWIAGDDVVGILHRVLFDPELSGPVNAAAPQQVRNQELTRVLGSVLERPRAIQLPESMVRLAFGQLGSEMLLSSARVHPRRLLERGFRFRHPDLEDALRRMLGRFEDPAPLLPEGQALDA